MSAPPSTFPLGTTRRVIRIQTLTLVWMSVEAAVSLFAAWRARSPALLAFGGDSAIELFSAVVVLWRFRVTAAHGDAERRAARVAGALLFALAAFVAVTSVTSLLGYSEPKPTVPGIAILVAAALVMPWLAKEKRRLSGSTGSAALRADAAQSALCAYLSFIALAVSRVATASRQSTPPPMILKMSREGTMICPPPFLGRSFCTNHALPSSVPFDTVEAHCVDG